MERHLLISAPFLSFYSQRFYRHVAATWRGMAHAYLLCLLGLCWIPFLIETYGNWSQFMGTWAQDLLRQIPPVSVSHGIVSVDAPQPHTIRDTETGKTLAILDTTGQIQSLDGVDAQMLLTRTQFILRKGAYETRTYDLSGVTSFALDRERVRGWLKLLATWGPPGLYVVLVPLSYMYRLLQSLLFAAIALALWRSTVPGLSYARALSIALVSTGPAIILKTGLDLLGLSFPFRELFILPVAFGYLWYAMSAQVKVTASESIGMAASD
jgi:hypothetical protein